MVDFGQGPVEFDDQQRLDVEWIAGMDERFGRMMRDPVRNLPRGGEWIYFWNVLDYAGWPVRGSADYMICSPLPGA